MGNYGLNVIGGIFEFFYVLLPVLSITILAYKFASETGRRTGSSLLFFSLVFYFIAVYESFYITARFGVIVSTELIFLQAIYISAGVFFASGVVSLRNFFVRFTGLGDLSLSSTFKRILIIVFIFVVLMLPYFLTQAYEGDLYLFNDVLYIFIQLQFFISYFLLGDIMMMNKGVCEKAPRRSRWIRVASLYYLIEPILWLWLLNSNLPNSILDKTYFATEVAGALVSGFLTFNILHILISHLPLLLDKYRSRYIAVLKSGIVKRLTIMLVLAGVTVILFGTLATGVYFDLQDQVFASRVSKDFDVIKVFARQTERELESLILRISFIAERGLSSEKVKDTAKSLKERYAEIVSNIFFFDKEGKIYYSYPGVVELTLPKKFVRGEFVATPILNDKSGSHSFILYPYFDKDGNFLGGIGVEFNFENLRGNLKKVTEGSSRILFLDSQLRIISADDTKVLGDNFIRFLKSQIDSPLNIKTEDLVKLGNFRERVYKNSRRTILNVSVVPLQFNSDKIFIIDYHFLDDFKIFDVLPGSALGGIALASIGVLISFILVLFLNFKFSEHLEFEIEKRTMELLKSEEKYRSIVENPFFGAYLMDTSGFKYVNDKFCEIFVYSKDEILNLKDYPILIHPEDRERLNQQLRKRLKGEFEVNKWSARGLRKDGQVIFIEGYTKRVEYEGKPAAQGMIIDVTEEIKRREALQQAQKLEALGTLAGGIAHDFNNILQIVIGAAQLLKMKVKDSEYAKWIDTIETTALRGAELARRLLTFSRKKPTGEMRPIDIHRLIEDSVKVFRETFPRNIEIETHFNAENHIILGEEAQVQQVILNLAINARDAMPEGGKLIFRTENRVGDGLNGKSDVEYLVMHVIDTGIGMTEEVKRRIFEPFFTTKPPGKGTGLGLSTVYGIVKSYDGFIKVYSEVGKGTKFSVYIPAYKERKEKDEARKKEEVKVKKTGTLLLIDDEEDIRFAGKELLEAEGFKVYTAGDGIEGLNIYREHKGEIDLVILDLNMPKMSGKETLSQLLLIDPNVKVIISTGYITESEKEEVEGVAGFVEKPFDINKLLKMISEALK